jgi:hypothetical protein
MLTRFDARTLSRRNGQKGAAPMRSIPFNAFIASSLICAAMAFLPVPTIARDTCSPVDIDIEVSATTRRERELVCAGAHQALDLLALCGIRPRETIDIRIRPEVRHPLAGLIFGYYDLGERRITIASLDGLPALMDGTPYAGLPPTDFYKSLVVHEVVHSVMHQNLGAGVHTQASYEYPAYALQIASLPGAAREQFMKAFESERLERPIPLNDTILSFAPYLFAARAYNHFITSADGCLLLREALKGEIDILSDAAR